MAKRIFAALWRGIRQHPAFAGATGTGFVLWVAGEILGAQWGAIGRTISRMTGLMEYLSGPWFPVTIAVVIVVLLWRIGTNVLKGETAKAPEIEAAAVRETEIRAAALDAVQAKIDAGLEEAKDLAKASGKLPAMIAHCWAREQRLPLMRAELGSVGQQVAAYEERVKGCAAQVSQRNDRGDPPLWNAETQAKNAVEMLARFTEMPAFEFGDWHEKPRVDHEGHEQGDGRKGGETYIFDPAKNAGFLVAHTANIKILWRELGKAQAVLDDETRSISQARHEIEQRMMDA